MFPGDGTPLYRLYRYANAKGYGFLAQFWSEIGYGRSFWVWFVHSSLQLFFFLFRRS